MVSFVQRVGRLREDLRAPLYLQLQQLVRQAIQTKVLTQDDMIPAERDLALEYGVSRITVRKAIDGLAQEGLVVRRRGSGTYVAARVADDNPGAEPAQRDHVGKRLLLDAVARAG